MPPLAFHWSTASLAPLYSHLPSELSWPLCASTTAILIGPDLPEPAPLDSPGASQAASSVTVSAPATSAGNRVDFMSPPYGAGGSRSCRERGRPGRTPPGPRRG